jgi:hypothetical protein
VAYELGKVVSFQEAGKQGSLSKEFSSYCVLCTMAEFEFIFANVHAIYPCLNSLVQDCGIMKMHCEEFCGMYSPLTPSLACSEECSCQNDAFFATWHLLDCIHTVLESLLFGKRNQGIALPVLIMPLLGRPNTQPRVCLPGFESQSRRAPPFVFYTSCSVGCVWSFWWFPPFGLACVFYHWERGRS